MSAGHSRQRPHARAAGGEARGFAGAAHLVGEADARAGQDRPRACGSPGRRRRAPGGGSAPRPRSPAGAGRGSRARGTSGRARAAGRCARPRTRRSSCRARRCPSGRSRRSGRAGSRPQRRSCAGRPISSRAAAAGSLAPNTAVPATTMSAPAATASRMLPRSMPPSTSICAVEAALDERHPQPAHLVEGGRGMKLWPPKPGFTDMTSDVVDLAAGPRRARRAGLPG